MGALCAGGIEPTEEDRKAECRTYVEKALERRLIVRGEAADFSECMCDISGEELKTQYLNHLKPAIVPERTRFMQYNFKKHNSDSEETVNLVDLERRTCIWRRNRREKGVYKLPSDHHSKAKEYSLDVSKSRKRLIYALGDLHIGGSWSEGMEHKLKRHLDSIMKRAKEEVAALVLLGNILEMWLEKYHEVPPSNEQRVKRWKKSSHCQLLVNSITKMVDDYGVKVFYIRGNHDQALTVNGIEVDAVFNEKVTFVTGTMILRLKTSYNDEVCARFAHGHEWDIFNSYMLRQTSRLIADKPLGYYIARAIATSGRKDEGPIDQDRLLVELAKFILNAIPDLLEDKLVSVLSEPEYQRKVLERLFKAAFNVNDIDVLMNVKCRVSPDSYVRLQKLLEYPLFSLHSSIVGEKEVFHMIKAATGDYEVFIKRLDEDVVVLAHTHRWDLKQYKNYKGNSVIYANTGCWTKHSDECDFNSTDIDRSWKCLDRLWQELDCR